MSDQQTYRCSVCGREMSKEDYEDYDRRCCECWEVWFFCSETSTVNDVESKNDKPSEVVLRRLQEFAINNGRLPEIDEPGMEEVINVAKREFGSLENALTIAGLLPESRIDTRETRARISECQETGLKMVNCPECGKPLKKDSGKAKYCCENSVCSVIFVRHPDNPSKMEIAYKASGRSAPRIDQNENSLATAQQEMPREVDFLGYSKVICDVNHGDCYECTRFRCEKRNCISKFEGARAEDIPRIRNPNSDGSVNRKIATQDPPSVIESIKPLANDDSTRAVWYCQKMKREVKVTGNPVGTFGSGLIRLVSCEVRECSFLNTSDCLIGTLRSKERYLLRAHDN